MSTRPRPPAVLALLIAFGAAVQWVSLKALLEWGHPPCVRDAQVAVGLAFSFVIIFAVHAPGLPYQRIWRPVSLMLLQPLIAASVLHVLRSTALYVNPAEQQVLGLGALLGAVAVVVTLLSGVSSPAHRWGRLALGTIGVVLLALLAARLDTYLKRPLFYAFSIDEEENYTYQYARLFWNAAVGLACLLSAALPRPH